MHLPKKVSFSSKSLHTFLLEIDLILAENLKIIFLSFCSVSDDCNKYYAAP